jgi:predicted GIY-YIG superfamily endonuclease
VPSSYFVYIVRCADGTLYTGCAKDPVERVEAHSRPRRTLHVGRRPVTLVYCEACDSHGDALRREHVSSSGPRKKTR